MAKSYRCGECKQLGHNKQTCAKRRTPKKISPPSAPLPGSFPPAPSSPVSHSTSPLSEKYRAILSREFDEPYEEYLHKRTQPEKQLLSIEELLTWWALAYDDGEPKEHGSYVLKKVNQKASDIIRFIQKIPPETRATITSGTWQQFFGRQNRLVLESIASQMDVPTEAWDVLASDTRGVIRQRVIANEVTPQKVLSKIYDDVTRECEEWKNATGVEKTSRTYRERIVGYEDLFARYGQNRRTPPHILNELSEHPSSWVRMNIAENLSLSTQNYDTFTHDRSEDVRMAVVRNVACPIEYVKELCDFDIDPKVRREARDMLGKHERLKKSKVSRRAVKNGEKLPVR